jgi:hypothetical protein
MRLRAWSVSRLARAPPPRCLSHSARTATNVVASAATNAAENLSNKPSGIASQWMLLQCCRTASPASTCPLSHSIGRVRPEFDQLRTCQRQTAQQSRLRQTARPRRIGSTVVTAVACVGSPGWASCLQLWVGRALQKPVLSPAIGLPLRPAVRRVSLLRCGRRRRETAHRGKASCRPADRPSRLRHAITELQSLRRHSRNGRFQAAAPRVTQR